MREGGARGCAREIYASTDFGFRIASRPRVGKNSVTHTDPAPFSTARVRAPQARDTDETADRRRLREADRRQRAIYRNRRRSRRTHDAEV